MNWKTLIIFIILSSITFSQKQNIEVTSNDFKELEVNNLKFLIQSYEAGYYRTAGRADWVLNETDFYQIIYDHGMCLIGKVDDSVRAGIRQWNYQYSRGPIINGRPAMDVNPQDSSRYRIYKITENDDASNIDYAEWPNDLGAPVDSLGNPKLFGDQTIWTIYNMADTNTIYYSPYNEKHELTIPVEVKETVYTHASKSDSDDDLLSNIIFIEYEFTNKGNANIDSAYWGFWTDIDYVDLFDNNPLVDTARQLGLCYSFENNQVYSEYTPAIGYSLLYGPIVPAVGDHGIYKGRIVSDSTNLLLNSFHPVLDDSYTMPDIPPDSSERMQFYNVMGPIDTYNQAWNVARGNGVFNWPYYNPYEQKYTHFPFDGNPVNQTGWYAYENTKTSNKLGGGAGFMFFSGPFTLTAGETQWVMLALVPALGEDNFDSITKLKSKVDQLRTLPYDSLAISNRIISSVDDKNESLSLSFELKQNYPNPFNPTTKIEYSLPEKSQVKIEVFNLLGQKVTTLINTEQSAGKHFVNWNAESYSSGIYFYKISAGRFVQTNKMMLLK